MKKNISQRPDGLDPIPLYKVTIRIGMNPGVGLMKIGEAAQLAGVNVQTLRYYERTGLLPRASRRPSGYREYDQVTVDVVHFIKHAQELGFSLRDIAELVGLRENPKDCSRAGVLARAKMTEIDRRIRNLTSIRKTLSSLEKACRNGDTNHHCPIIEALSDPSP